MLIVQVIASWLAAETAGCVPLALVSHGTLCRNDALKMWSGTAQQSVLGLMVLGDVFFEEWSRDLKSDQSENVTLLILRGEGVQSPKTLLGVIANTYGLMIQSEPC